MRRSSAAASRYAAGGGLGVRSTMTTTSPACGKFTLGRPAARATSSEPNSTSNIDDRGNDGRRTNAATTMPISTPIATPSEIGEEKTTVAAKIVSNETATGEIDHDPERAARQRR